jgi:enoyl-CoA hydratase/carnithine racemase
MLATILDFPYPTVALLNGHTFGGACLIALAHDYRIMNSQRGFFQMPPINLGLYFEGIAALPKAKLAPHVARKLLLQAHKFTGKEALQDGIVDAVAAPDQLFDMASQIAETWAGKAKMDVYGLIRNDLYGEALAKFRAISYVHGRMTSRPATVKL